MALQDGTVLVLGRPPGQAIGQGRPRTTNFSDFWTTEDEDVEDRDENVRGRRFSKNCGTSGDEDVDVLRRPGLKLNF